jgi:glycosyltransferase involved in cell wall biosynthesis
MIPTFQSAETIERTMQSVLVQDYRPLEIVVYDECSTDSTRAIVERLFAEADPAIETRLATSEENSGPVRAWRVALHAATGDWCSFVWADDVLKPAYSTTMMAAATRAIAEGRKLVTCSAEVEADEELLPYYALDEGIATPTEYSEGIFLRRFPISQICSIYETHAARDVFDRHIQIENPHGYDYERHPYGNDVGFLSELGAEGSGGVELIGERLVTLVLSPKSMTRRALHDHIWQHRWQYTFNFLRVWRWWAARGVADAPRLCGMAERRLALCSLMLGGFGSRFHLSLYPKALRAFIEYRQHDYQVTRSTLDEHRRRIAARRHQPSHLPT